MMIILTKYYLKANLIGTNYFLSSGFKFIVLLSPTDYYISNGQGIPLFWNNIFHFNYKAYS